MNTVEKVALLLLAIAWAVDSLVLLWLITAHYSSSRQTPASSSAQPWSAK